MQDYKLQLVKEAEKFNENKKSRRSEILSMIQGHAIMQIKNGYTGFRIINLHKEEEGFLKEWADMSSATVKVIKFKCYENEKKYLIRHFEVDLRNITNINCKNEGNTLKINN